MRLLLFCVGSEPGRTCFGSLYFKFTDVTESVTRKGNEMKTETKKKQTLNELQRRGLVFSIIAVLTFLLMVYPQMTIFAADGAAIVTESFSSIIDIVTAMVSSIGAIILLWAFFEVGVSMQSQEGTMQAMGFKRIGGGLVMTLAPQLTTAIIG